MSHPERIVPDEAEPGIVAIHAKRYEFALPYCVGKRVLDAGCGVGYGSSLLGEAARSVLGVDVSPDAIAYARERYGTADVEFAVADLLDLDVEPQSFDVVVSFEVIEHLQERESYLRNVERALTDDGLFVVSTPRADETTSTPDNPFHAVEFSASDFEHLLGAFFADVELYGQRRIQTLRHRTLQRLDVFGLRRRLTFLRPAAKLLGTRPTAELSSVDLAIEKHDVDSASELVAVCRRPRRA